MVETTTSFTERLKARLQDRLVSVHEALGETTVEVTPDSFADAAHEFELLAARENVPAWPGIFIHQALKVRREFGRTLYFVEDGSAAQVGKVITVAASYVDGHGAAESVASSASAAAHVAMRARWMTCIEFPCSC